MHKVRVLVIDDSAFMRKMITDILSSDDRIHVIDTARNGEMGLKKIKQYNPAVVTLYVEMQVMDGITTLKKIMETHPLPVIMLASVTGLGANKTVEAITNGAVDFITKPSGSISLDIKKIKKDRKSTRLNSSHVAISYAVVCLKKKTTSVDIGVDEARRATGGDPFWRVCWQPVRVAEPPAAGP